jgi:hypothetical protein
VQSWITIAHCSFALWLKKQRFLFSKPFTFFLKLAVGAQKIIFSKQAKWQIYVSLLPKFDGIFAAPIIKCW